MTSGNFQTGYCNVLFKFLDKFAYKRKLLKVRNWCQKLTTVDMWQNVSGEAIKVK